MPQDLSLELRRAVLAHLRADASVTALVPADKIYGEFATSEDFPFIRIGYQSTIGYEATCWDGSESDLTIHAFANGPGTDGIAQICKRVVASMAEFSPAIYGMPENEWVSTNVMPDDIPHKLHGVMRFRMVMVDVG